MKHNWDANGKCIYCERNAVDIILEFYTDYPKIRNELIEVRKNYPKYYDMTVKAVFDLISNKVPCLTDDEFTVKDIIK